MKEQFTKSGTSNYIVMNQTADQLEWVAMGDDKDAGGWVNYEKRKQVFKFPLEVGHSFTHPFLANYIPNNSNESQME